MSDAAVEHEPTAADFLKTILDRPATVNWKQWRDAQEDLRETCPCRVHTYARWVALTRRTPRPVTNSKTMIQEWHNVLAERQKFAFEVGILFDLIPEENWPPCRDQGEES